MTQNGDAKHAIKYTHKKYGDHGLCEDSCKQRVLVVYYEDDEWENNQ